MSDDVPSGYISGLGRDVPHPRVAHLYRGTFDEPGMAMCPKGYNRGTGYSIWRNNVGAGGICKRCMRRAQAGLPPMRWPIAPPVEDAQDGER